MKLKCMNDKFDSTQSGYSGIEISTIRHWFRVEKTKLDQEIKFKKKTKNFREY